MGIGERAFDTLLGVSAVSRLTHATHGWIIYSPCDIVPFAR